LASTNYSVSMLPARKRPRRTCSVTNESEYSVVVVTFLFREGHLTTNSVTSVLRWLFDQHRSVLIVQPKWGWRKIW
jgi:hypothetical protein